MSMIIEIGALAIIIVGAWRLLRRREPSMPLARVAAPVLGVYAGLLGAAHGVFEIRQGSGKPDSLLINAIGPPCEPSEEWHACFPALTVVPDYLIAGVLTVVLALAVLMWAALFVQRKRGGLVLIGLAVLLLLAGGGFFPPFYALLGGVAGVRMRAAGGGE